MTQSEDNISQDRTSFSDSNIPIITTTKINPHAGFVVKIKNDENDKKYFINITHHTALPQSLPMSKDAHVGMVSGNCGLGVFLLSTGKFYSFTIIC